MQVTTRLVSDLTPDPANARKHSERNIEAIAGSLRRFGQQTPIVVDSSGVVRKGNGTLLAAQYLGWSELDAIETDLKGSEATAYAIADNRTAELAEWDDGVLLATLEGLQVDDEDLLEATGFSEEELERLAAASSNDEPEGPEDFPEVDESIETNRECPKCGYRWSGE